MRCLEIIILLFALNVLPLPSQAWRADIVKTWARTIGEELWNLSESLTMSDQIKTKYKKMNASVKKKDGRQILESSLQSVSTMLTRKINAVKCIHKTAERLARNADFNYSSFDSQDFSFEYCSAKYSQFTYEESISNASIEKNDADKDPPKPKFVLDNPDYFRSVSLEKDSHFYNISVNTNMSCVHVPTNIYHKEKEVLNTILWSEDLDAIFLKNYESDPSLAWQYFGSAHGILRFYPAMPWQKNELIYDCRVKPWYIEAATCSKDVIILFDVSGSMTGFKNYVARQTLRALLDTLSNNDYVNVYYMKNDTNEVVTCFVELVQATRENLETIYQTLQPTNEGKDHKIPLEGNANLTIAYTKAFTTLQKRRQNCDVAGTQGCNQLVMLITDYVPGNLTEVFEEYNREVVNDTTYIPVRVFTYLIGKEVTNVQEIQWMACLNRGYFVHIHSVEEVQQQVLKYINVIARPMILAGEEPPPTWTHANIDNTRTGGTSGWNVSGDVEKPDEDKLVTSVAIPVFDYKYNDEHNDAMLLGVAGTDVPIDSISKLAQPHQLGVNGYSFIVSNNGYLLLHPLLIATINDELQQNYNSVDFVEVEQVDDGKGPRELGVEIKRLRYSLVFGVKGSETGIKVLFHYDRMRRIARVKHDYFFDNLVGTPFSMGISLPRGYGDTELLLKDNPLEAKQGQDLVGVNVTDYFRYSYRIHPDWVYCKYHYLEGHESKNMEIEIWKFLANISRNELDITKKQYGEETHTAEFDFEKDCGSARVSLGKDDYYCNEDLVKQLVFDAKLTEPYFKKWDVSRTKRRLAEKYDVSVRFIATASGLTRWHYISDDSKNERVDDFGETHKEYSGKVFGDYHHNAIEEIWYQAAVLQHIINNESLVISTPLPILDEVIYDRPSVIKDDNVEITASNAIFYKDGNSKTPASVVGFQFSYNHFRDRFMELTKENSKRKDILSCDGNKYDCYIIDSSGYVVISKNITEVGKFFGEINALVLQSFITKNIFEFVEVFNYQALCPTDMLPNQNRGWNLITPFNVIGSLIRWLITEAVILLTNWDYYAFSAPIPDYDYLDSNNNMDAATSTETPTIIKDGNETTPPPKPEKKDLFSCDHKISLYILNQSRFIHNKAPISEEEGGPCHPPYWASSIPYTNLLLVVIESGYSTIGDCRKPPTTKPEATPNSTTSREPCHKLDLGGLPRRPLEGCFTYNEEERNITACGHGHNIKASALLLFASAVVLPVIFTSLLF